MGGTYCGGDALEGSNPGDWFGMGGERPEPHLGRSPLDLG